MAHSNSTSALSGPERGGVVGGASTIRGRISGADGLHIEGRVEGSIAMTGHVVVEAGAVVVADIEAASVEVRGDVTGDLTASSRAVIDAHAVVHGNIRAPRVVVREGARVSGAIDMTVDLPASEGRSGEARGERRGRRGR